MCVKCCHLGIQASTGCVHSREGKGREAEGGGGSPCLLLGGRGDTRSKWIF